MRSSKLVVLSALAAVLVFAAATSAYAAGSGTVYGQATMQPTVSIVLSGPGSDPGWPLTFQGVAGDRVWADNGRITVNNNGDVAVPLLLGFGSDPTDGASVWSLGDNQAATQCIWDFYSPTVLFNAVTRVPSNVGIPVSFGPTALAVGDYTEFDSQFRFPTSFDGTPHTMTALIIAGN